jgi:periplasmic protein TonB
MRMLATKHLLLDSIGSAGPKTGAPIARLRTVRDANPSGRGAVVANSDARRRFLVLGATLAAHALLVTWVWHATPWSQVVKRPTRIEVVLIAPPELETRPPLIRHVPDRAPTKWKAAPMLARVAEPVAQVPLAVPILLTAPPVEAPVTAVEAPVVAEAPIPAAVAVAPPPVDVIPPRFDAAYLDNPAPTYPALSRRAREEGRVVLRVLVSADGRAQTIEIARSSGSERLDEAAIDAVRRWRFVPARRGDANVAAQVQVPVAFSLRR